MKVLQINTVYQRGGSTGRIAYDLMQIMRQEGIDGYAAYGENLGEVSDEKTLCLQSHVLRRKLNILRTRLFDHHGFYNEYETKKLIRWMDEIRPDVIHLHNIHNHYVNVKMLFDYIKQHDIPVVWTLHDCWSFTGHCAYFDVAHCDKWKTCCYECPSLKDYPPTWFFDRTCRNYNDKKAVFTGVKNLVLCPPSQWLGNLTRESFLNEYPVVVINNGVDTDVFKPVESNVRKKYGLGNRKMILAVMNMYDKRKGTDFLERIPNELHDDEVLVVVGLKNEHLSFYSNVHSIAIQRTENVQELVALYSAADVFINPTLEDNFPTTNIEALACGTPIVTFRTGGSIESVTPETGIVVEQHDFKGLLSAIRSIIPMKQSMSSACVKKAKECYNKNKQYLKYIDLYKRIVNQ